jgi:porin
VPGGKVEHGVEVNALVDVAPMVFVQPVAQYYVNVGGGVQHALVIGFRTKVEL